MVINASEIDSSIFVWLLVVLPILGIGIGVAAWLLARHRRLRHPIVAGLAAGVSAVIAAHVCVLVFDALNG